MKGGCAGAVLAFTIAGGAILVLEKTWPYILAIALVAVILAAFAGARRGELAIALDPGKAKGQWFQGVRMTDSEREQVARALMDAAADGRIDRDELEERVDAAYRAKCWADVKGLIADLGL